MKKILSLTFLSFFFYAVVQRKKEPEISDFSQSAFVDWNGFTYNCIVSLTGDIVTVQIISTNASGLKIVYDGEKADFIYDDMEYNIANNNLYKTNPAIAVYDALGYLKTNPEIKCASIKDGFEYYGKTNIGDFILT
ncbi:MAG: hypothetical protein LIO43_05290, partial [Clostridiales bacterium]|nr:hypothetical protein [Clostridiales bacterium]